MSESLPERTGPPSDRVRVRRLPSRARYRRSEVLGILDAGLVAHVGVVTPQGPLVLPMAYGRDESHIYLHGALANHLLGSGADREVCITVTHLDGLVMARTPFHNSMNYRSAVVRGRARRVTDDDRKLRALRLITDHIAPNWDTGRRPSPSDLRATSVVEVPLAEASAKVREGGPKDEPADMSGPWWAGLVPLTTRFRPPVSSPDLSVDAEPPTSIAALAGLTPDERPRA